MAKLVMAAATPHNPLLWRTMRDPIPDDLQRVAANFAMIRDTMRELEVDVIIEIGTDHIRQFYADNSPAFIIGTADRYPGTFENEARLFGQEYHDVIGHKELAHHIIGREVLTDAIDFSFSQEWRLDHGFMIPLFYVRPEFDLPVVPIHINATMPPLPRAERFAVLGRHLAESVRTWESDSRVALLTSGHMATDVGGSRQFLGGVSPDPEFDRDAVSWFREGNVEGAIAGCNFERVIAAGNMTYQHVNIIAALTAMGGRPADFAEATESRFAASPFYMWRNDS